MSQQERPDGIYRRPVVEGFRLHNKQFTAFRDDKAAIGIFQPPRKRLDGRRAAFFEPARSDCGLDLEMDFVLIHKDQGVVVLDLVAFFLKDSRSSVSSYPLLG